MPFFEDFTIWKYLASIVDILLVSWVIYKLLNLIKGTKAVQLLKGIVVILLIRVVSEFFGLNTLSWLTQQAIDWGFLAIIIIFQPELRRALEQLGRGRFFHEPMARMMRSKRKWSKRLLRPQTIWQNGA